MARIAYVCPTTHRPLEATQDGLQDGGSHCHPYLNDGVQTANPIPNFLSAESASQDDAQNMYARKTASEIYRNFLDWLFATFEVTETEFRQAITQKLRLAPGKNVLVTGCGLGDDIFPIVQMIAPAGEVYAQDISVPMVQAGAEHIAKVQPDHASRVFFSVCDALKLPFADSVFDAAFHFGGINLFGDVGQGLCEMNRVVKSGGRVVVGDEGVAPWLRETDYANMVITNNPLWACEAPLDKIPPTAADVNVSWILGNCFWLIDFEVRDSAPKLNPHVIHLGRRGGSMWTRHAGQLEGVTPQTREKIIQAAADAGISVHDWLEQTLAGHIKP